MREDILRRLHAGFDSGRFYTRLYNLRRPPTPENITLGMNVEVESLRLEVLLLRPTLPPQHDLSPQRSPAAGTEELNGPGEPHPKMQQTEQEGN